MKQLKFAVIFAGMLNYSLVSAASLSVDDYLSQVEGQNQNLTSAKQGAQGAELTVGEAGLLFTPSVFAETQWYKSYFTNSTFPSAYKSIETNNYTVGVREQTPFGLNASLSYLLSKQGYLGTTDFVTGQIGDRRFYEGTPKLELTLSLWRNFLGAESKATEDATRSAALANEYGSRYQVKATRAQAENAYVRLVSAQQMVKIYQDSMKYAEDILGWNKQRIARSLGENADMLQAEANYQAQKLSLQGSIDEQRSAGRDFNRLRNVDSDEVSEVLALPSISKIEPPARAEIRDDVRAAQENVRYTAAQSRLGQERNRPTLEAFGSLALNSRDTGAGDTFSESFRLGQQTTAYGLRFNMPLAFGTESDVIRGYHLQQNAAETQVAQKIFDQDVEWKDLVQQLNESKKRYDIAESLAGIQKRKVENERTRLHQGRTTTYQTLIFNIDYNTAEVALIQAQATVLGILARMKTFGEKL